MKRVCVFCGSRTGTNPVHAETARAVGRALVARGWGLVFGGGRIGLMGEVAAAATAAGGEVIGVIPHVLSAVEIAYSGATELIVVGTMHERKAIMADRADAFVALPGGYGTCDELFEILTWSQLGIHRKPVVVLNVAGFFHPLLAWADHMVSEGFLKPKHRARLLVADTIPDLFATLDGWQPPPDEGAWAKLDER
ncbi:TIGR00730 family Rossman fold protein [Fimbriiglobus ruber]|uniref:Cytokinin riboside 5'-monophosphate phosphoribohydrolase n=1 Tax=Fimbriiglobus ruber TaxID=1908690 RepID=A0A225DIY9_9BACT|nr:TIGR00730 family Rossman fold protein [Fimbriiglobus ruber]OWK40943.1 Lysine decarboxylase family [Fimbriiglobus ruber]